MCIRDSVKSKRLSRGSRGKRWAPVELECARLHHSCNNTASCLSNLGRGAVSYTHLTLPTICSV
eukprot:2423879-Alexandrium_andersonii.AAC.1